MIIWYRIKEIFPWFIGVLVLLSSNWAANSLQDSITAFFESPKVEISWLHIGYIIFFLSMIFLLYKYRSAFFQPRTRYLKGESPEKHEHLIIFLSELNTKVPLNEGIPTEVNFEGDFEKDLKKLVEYKNNKPFWRWEMPMRAIYYHIGKLKTITIICSPESILQIEWFQKILKKYHELNSVDIKILAKQENKPILIDTFDQNIHTGWEFEQFDDLSRALIYLFKEFCNRKIPEKSIIIDFTGGQKVTSVVAAAVTFNRKIKAQYVQTGNPWSVASYDILLGSAEVDRLSI